MKILVVAAHPDDEAIGCGGFVTVNTNAGNEVQVVFLTSGEHGIPGTSAELAGQTRELEAQRASKILGSSIVGFWRQPDGALAYSEALRDRMVELIETEQPKSVLVTHLAESHPDHRAAAVIVREALKKMKNPPECLMYEIWTPMQRTERIFNISDSINIKLEAIGAHASQVTRQAFDAASFSLSRYRGVMQGRCFHAEVFNKMRLSGGDMMNITLALMTWAPSVTHPRAAYAYRTLDAALNNIEPGENALHVHIADDGSDPQHIQKLVDICSQYGFDPSITNSERGGYGKSYNLMMQVVHPMSDLVLPLEDDWELTRPLKLENIARAIDSSGGVIRSIRLGYLGFTQRLSGHVVSQSGMLYLLLDPDSAEPHVFAGHPRLESVDYQRDVGVWPEGIAAGQTEWEVAKRWPARTGVAWPLDLGIPASQDWGTLFAHIGSEGVGEVEPPPAPPVRRESEPERALPTSMF